MKFIVGHRKKKTKAVLGKSKQKAKNKHAALYAARKEYIEKHPKGPDVGAEEVDKLTFSILE